MHYDEATGNMIGDDDSYMSAPYRSVCSGYSSYSDEPLINQYRAESAFKERIIDFFKMVKQVLAGAAVAAVLIYCGIMVKDRCSNGRWNSFGETLDKLLLRNNRQSHDPGSEESGQMVQSNNVYINRISTSCCYCGGGFTIELTGSPDMFDVNCPYCYRSIHYTRKQ